MDYQPQLRSIDVTLILCYIMLMSILKLEIPDGEPLPRNQRQVQPEISKMILDRVTEFEMLHPGDYDITPKIWTKHAHTYELTVLSNGEGLFRVFPKTKESGYQQFSESKSTEFNVGGKTNPEKAETPLYIVSGGHPNKMDLQIFGVIMYI